MKCCTFVLFIRELLSLYWIILCRNFSNFFKFYTYLIMSSDLNYVTDDDSEDEELAQEVIRDKTTRNSFLLMINAASDGADLIKVINLLPNSSQRYGLSITLNAVVKIVSCHSTFKDHQCTAFYTTKRKRNKETKGDINIQYPEPKQQGAVTGIDLGNLSDQQWTMV
jgi:hypothetical protein